MSLIIWWTGIAVGGNGGKSSSVKSAGFLLKFSLFNPLSDWNGWERKSSWFCSVVAETTSGKNDANVALFNGFFSVISFSNNELLSVVFVWSRGDWSERFSLWFSYGFSSSVNGRSSVILFGGIGEDIFLSGFIIISLVKISAAEIPSSSRSRCDLKFSIIFHKFSLKKEWN